MKKQFTLSIALAVTLSTAFLTNAQANDSTVNIKMFFGDKGIDSDAWSAQDDHGTVGILTDFKTGYEGMRVALDLFGSGSEEKTSSQVKGTYTAEAHLGIRKYFELQSKFEPYIGGGINLAYASQKNDNGSEETEEEDMDSGLWLNSGVDFFVNDNITIGIDLRYSNAALRAIG